MSTPQALVAAGPSFIDPEWLISTFGLIGILAIIFAESGCSSGFSSLATRCCSPPDSSSPTAATSTNRSGSSACS